MAKVFISYRRDDSGGFAGRLYDHVAEVLGEDNVFRDVDAIGLGSNFEEEIEVAMAQCDVLFAVIGPRFVDEENEARLRDEGDYLRRELVAGLRSAKTRVVPVLVGDAELPAPDELPADLTALTSRQAFEVRDAQFDSDVNEMMQRLDLRLRRRSGALIGGAVAAIAAVGLAIAFWPQPAPGPDPTVAPTTAAPTTTTAPSTTAGTTAIAAPVVRDVFPPADPPEVFDADAFVDSQPVKQEVRFKVVVDNPEELTYEWFSSRDGVIGTEADFRATLTGACFGRAHDITVIVRDGAGQLAEAKTQVVVRSAMLTEEAICPIVAIPNFDLELLSAQELATALRRDQPELWEQLTTTELVAGAQQQLGEDSTEVLTSVYAANPQLAATQVRLIDPSLLANFTVDNLVDEIGG